jgi:DNA-binding transcriptional LysR family regulator
MDRVEAMRTFLRVAELGSFSAVAQQSEVARSVVTRQVAALERHLGTRLMVRSTRKVSLTSAGTMFLEKCRVIVNLVDAAETDLAQERAVVRGNVRVGLPLSYGLKRLAPLLLEFGEQHPQVHLEMDYTDRRVDLVEEGFDLSVRITGRLAPSDVVRRLGTCRLMAVASPDYLARHGKPAHPSELVGHECLAYTGDPRRDAWTFTVDDRAETVYVTSRLRANNGDVLVDAAARGFGIALQPDFIVQPLLADGRLQQVLQKFSPPELGIYAVLPATRSVPYRVRVLIDFLAERLRVAEKAQGPGSRRARAR